ncbi:hypothetical protein ACFVY1_29570 [Streptomyces sp. NPDC058293]|uniref:hypothetical protein n=1 Tax=Streptomyces sp. NPDC058293 TaxID=3346429 RepID=UPI0036E5B036
MFDGAETGEVPWRHQLLPVDEVVDGPHVVFGGIEADPAQCWPRSGSIGDFELKMNQRGAACGMHANSSG